LKRKKTCKESNIIDKVVRKQVNKRYFK